MSKLGDELVQSMGEAVAFIIDAAKYRVTTQETTMSDTPEGRLKRKLVDYFKTVPGLWWAPYVQNGYGKAGVPDYILCVRGRFLALEVKANGKAATKWQKQQIAEIIDAGGGASVIGSVAEAREMIDVLLGGA